MTEPSDVLGQLLLRGGAISLAALEEALEDQRRRGGRIGEVLIRRRSAGEDDVYRALATQLNLPFLQPPLHGDAQTCGLVRPEFAREHRLFPLMARGRTLRVATADPLDLDAFEDLRFQTGRRVDMAISTPRGIEEAIGRAYPEDVAGLVADLPEELTGNGPGDRASLERAARAAPLVRLVDHILSLAIREGASDIHIEPSRDLVQVRIRVDGVLRPALELPRASHRALVSRIKVMSEMDISVRLRPQDGGFPLDTGPAGRTARVSTLPSSEGEKVVVRILDPHKVPSGLAGLGMAREDLRRVRELIGRAQGVILVTGPTGSGKSSTLFGALAEVDRRALNVVTLEDPVEYHLPDATQVQVNSRTGLGFPEALRAVLRQDPDVVMVGEIRDRETAEIAMSAAVTGHLVLSTLHTMDAPGAIIRLLNMGVPPHLVSAGLTGVVAQRLVRRVCRGCSGAVAGCHDCQEGLSGRIGVFQVLVMSDPLRDSVMQSPTGPRLRELAIGGGMGTFLADAHRHVEAGTTLKEEAARVVQAYVDARIPCPSCETVLPPRALGCPSCGVGLRLSCRCGFDLMESWRFCPGCLRPVPQTSVPALHALSSPTGSA